VGVLEPGGELDLALEAVVAEADGELGMEHLERHRPVVPQVLRKIDRGHTAAPELALERVTALQRFTKCRDRIRHQSRFSEGRAKRYDQGTGCGRCWPMAVTHLRS
jgi:hypothetical protein